MIPFDFDACAEVDFTSGMSVYSCSCFGDPFTFLCCLVIAFYDLEL